MEIVGYVYGGEKTKRKKRKKKKKRKRMNKRKEKNKKWPFRNITTIFLQNF